MYTQSERDDMERLFDKLRYVGYVLLALHLLLNFPEICIYIDNEGTFISHSIFINLYQTFKKLPIFTNFLIAKILALSFVLVACFGPQSRKDEQITIQKSLVFLFSGILIYFLADVIYYLQNQNFILYGVLTISGLMLSIQGGSWLTRALHHGIGDKVFNDDNETFPQNEILIQDEDWINFETEYIHQGEKRKGTLNVFPYRSTLVMGTPGSGKTFSILIPALEKSIQQGFAAFVYDFKFPDMTEVAYKALLNYKPRGISKPKFYLINFEDVSRSHRCNPIDPKYLVKQLDADTYATTLLFNLNRDWIKRQDYFVNSAISITKTIIWYLKIVSEENRNNYLKAKQLNPNLKPNRFCNVCTLPHLIEFLAQPTDKIFPILKKYPALESLMSPFADALDKEVYEQLAGQISSAQIALGRLIDPSLYWVLSGNDFSLDLNDEQHPKVLCLGNYPKNSMVYGAALGLFNVTVSSLVNQKGRRKLGIFFDELPTIYFMGLRQLITTARSNKVAPWLGIQDISQLKLDYGAEEAKAITSTIGNLISGQVLEESAKNVSERIGKTLQVRKSMTDSRNDLSVSTSTQLEVAVPPSKMANLSQGYFAGALADTHEYPIERKIFHAKILVDKSAVKKRETGVKIPVIYDFERTFGKTEQEILQQNFEAIKSDIVKLIAWENQKSKVRMR
jgi:YWFCY protein/Type IV secretory system Conjugative DNA transfer